MKDRNDRWHGLNFTYYGLLTANALLLACALLIVLLQVHPLLQRTFNNWHFVFSGKIAYTSGMEGTQVVPVQALTSILYVMVSLLSTLLFLKSSYALAFVLTIIVTQGWRTTSETLRADHRGWGKKHRIPDHGNSGDHLLHRPCGHPGQSNLAFFSLPAKKGSQRLPFLA